MDAASGVARYDTSARAAGESLNIITVSPPPTTVAGELLIDGNGKTLYPVTGFAGVLLAISPWTKSASMTIAAFGEAWKTWSTLVGKSVCSAPEVPPARFWVSPRTWAMVFSAAITDGSVHLMVWFVSWSYFA